MSEEEVPAKSERPDVRPVKKDTRDSDKALRPGFRNPPNSRSKAQKGRKKKK